MRQNLILRELNAEINRKAVPRFLKYLESQKGDGSSVSLKTGKTYSRGDGGILTGARISRRRVADGDQASSRV